MRTTDIENLYNKITGHMSLVGAYTEDLSLIKIIRSCRLKPYSIFTGDFEPGTRFEQHWVDEFGNSMRFTGKVPRVVMGDTGLEKDTQTSTDLFFGNSMRTIAHNSTFTLMAGGKFYDNDCYIVAFYGQDEYIRCFFYHEVWSRVSPLMLGIDTLHMLFMNMNNVLIHSMNVKKLDLLLPFDVEKCIITSWPPKQNLLTYFDDRRLLDNIL